MNSSDLHKRIAEVLGVSTTQKDLAFEVFTGKVVEILTEGVTLKVPQVGYFQLKEGNIKNKISPQLIFSAFPEDYSHDSKTLFLTIDINPRIKNNIEFDSQVFSIGVGKPLLPLLEDDERADSETTFALLRKSIEERVKEVISESDQIPNFDMWEDIVNQQLAEESGHVDAIETLSRLTRDLDLTPGDEEIETKPNREENLLQSLLGEPRFDITDDFSNDDYNFNSDSTSTGIEEEPMPIDDALFEDKKNFNDELRVDDILDEPVTLPNANSNFEASSISVQDEEILPASETETNNNFLSLSFDASSSEEETVNDDLLDTLQIGQIPQEINNKYELLDLLLPPEPLEDFNHRGGQVQDHDQDKDQDHEQELMRVKNAEQTFSDNLEEEPVDSNSPVKRLEDMIFISEEFGSDETPASMDEIKEKDEDEIHHVEDLEEKIEITIQPPTAAKQILIDLIQEEKSLQETQSTLNKVIGDDNELEGIISEELKSYDEDKIAEENSRILNNLLEEVTSRKSLPTETDEDYEATIDEEAEFESIEESIQRIEWNWGDELKEEFGIGSEPEDETDFISPVQSGINLEIEKMDIRPELEEVQKSIEFDLEKTRQDLFSRLEKTLEHEVTSLRDEIEKPVTEFKDKTYTKLSSAEAESDKSLIEKSYTDTNQRVSFTKAEITDEQSFDGGLNIKDEKVFLDFKTPPPKYEFIEEEVRRPEPILRPPKKMTILLSPEDQEEEPDYREQRRTTEKRRTQFEPEPKQTYTREEEQYIGPGVTNQFKEYSEPDTKKRKGQMLPVISIVLSSLVIITAIVGYFLMKWNFTSPTKEENKISSQASETQQSFEPDNTIKNETYTPNDSISFSEEFSDFPRTATPPEPIKEGSNYVYLKMPISAASKTEEKKSDVNAAEKKVPEVKKNVETKPAASSIKKPVKETKVRDMVYFDGKFYSFQTSSWKAKAKAEQEVNRLRALGLNAFAVEVNLPEKGGTWYRVRVGSFNSEKEAAESMRKNNF